MINKKAIISLAIILSIMVSNVNTIPISAFAGYDDVYNGYNDNYSYNSSEDDTYSDYIYGIYIDEDTAVQIIPEEEDTFSDLTYIIENDQVTITGYDPTVNFGYYTMPTIINGYPVTSIAENAFKDCKSLITIVIPNTVKTVGAYAFNGCTKLESVTFENNVEEIPQDDDSEDIEDSTDTSYDTNSFEYFDNADNSYDYDYNSYDYNSYDYNSYGYNDDDSDSQDYDYSYDYGYGDDEEEVTSSTPDLQDVNLFDYYNGDSYDAHSDDDTYETVDIESYKSKANTEETTITTEEEEVNIAVNPVAEYSSTLREGLTMNRTGVNAIMEHAFNGCSSLSSISVPNTLSYMGAYCIEDTKYYSDHIDSNQTIILGSVLYKYLTEYTYSYQYNSSTAKYEAVANPFDDEIEEGIISISYSAFSGVTGLTNLTMPESLKTIYDDAFYGCTDLTNITFYDGIQYIGNNAFTDTPWLEESNNGFAVAGDYLYKYVGKGGAITVPTSVKIIGNEAFALDSNITRAVIQDGVEKIMGGAFYRCENLQTVVVSGTVQSIGNQAFYGCKNLTRITFSDGLVSIGEKCFISCSKLAYIIIPSTVTQIGDMCFGFDYSDIYVSYSIIDGFTVVGEEGSTAQKYAESKTINFKTKDEFVVPSYSEEYTVAVEDEEEDISNPLDKKTIFYIVGSLTAVFLILCLILYIIDRKRNPKKYRNRRKKTRRYKNYMKYKQKVAQRNQNQQNTQNKK